MTPENINIKATAFGWAKIQTTDPHMVSFGKLIDSEVTRVNVWPGKKTVGIYLTLPKKGKSQLFRKWVTPGEMEKIFQDPISQAEKGYQ